MSRCENCESYVSESYVRVFSTDGETVGCCPRCRDKLRDSTGRVREARMPRNGARGVDDEGALGDD